MKYILGVLSIALLLFIAMYGILWLYDVPMFEPLLFKKLLLTIGAIVILAVLLMALIPFFFANHFKGYDQQKGNVAHPKN